MEFARYTPFALRDCSLALRVGTAACLLAGLASASLAARPDGRLRLEVVDSKTGDALPARLHLRDARDRPVTPPRDKHAWGAAPLGDHAYLDGAGDLLLRRGAYRFDLDAGPEYRTRHGRFEIARHADDTKRIEAERIADLAAEGWFAADLATHRPPSDAELLRRAEQLTHTSTVVAVWRDDGWRPPATTLPRQRSEPIAGATLLWDTPRGVVWLIDPEGLRQVDQAPTPAESSVDFLRAARAGGWRVVAAITSAELPLWVAAEVVDAVVAIDGWSDSPAGEAASGRGRQADALRYPGGQGVGRWRRHLYESLVDAGVRLAPVGLSGSGLNTRPIGDARTYAHTGPPVGDDASTEAWWSAVDDLAVVATNGPLLRPLVEGAPPGATFLLEAGGIRTLAVGLNLATRTPVEYLELVKNGRVEHGVRLADLAPSGGRLPEVTFDAPGWLSVVAVTETQDRYQLAMSAPWFVEGPEPRRPDRQAVDEWLAALREARAAFGDNDPAAYDEAEAFWRQRLNEN